MNDFDVSRYTAASDLTKIAQDSRLQEARDGFARDQYGSRFQELLGQNIELGTPTPLTKDQIPGADAQAYEGLIDPKVDSFFRMPDAERSDEEGFTLEELPLRLQREMTPVFELYSGPTPGEADGFMSQLDMKAAIDDGVVGFRFAGDEGFKPKVNLDNIPWQKISAFLAHENGVGETDDIHAGPFVDSVELLLGGEAAGVVFDDLDVAMLHELHGELTSVDGHEGASAVELALLLQSEEYSLEELLPPRFEVERNVMPNEDGLLRRAIGEGVQGQHPIHTLPADGLGFSPSADELGPLPVFDPENLDLNEPIMGPFPQLTVPEEPQLMQTPVSLFGQTDIEPIVDPSPQLTVSEEPQLMQPLVSLFGETDSDDEDLFDEESSTSGTN